MAALIRLKRKRHDDPTEAVVLSCKKSKATHCGSDVREVFRLAGTFDLNDDSAVDQVLQAGIPAGKRTLDNGKLINSTDSPAVTAGGQREIKLVNLHTGAESEELSDTASQQIRLYDAVLNQTQDCLPALVGNDDDVIVCNGEAMVKVHGISDNQMDEDFVYDYFYLESGCSDLDHAALEDLLCMEAFGEEYAAFQQYRDDRLFEDDDDDSNAEENWRNDYPDEDFENSDENEYQSGDEFAAAGYTNMSRIHIASSEDDGSDDGVGEFGSDDTSFERYYSSYKKSKRQERAHSDDESFDNEKYGDSDSEL